MYSISEISNLTGISAFTLRYYEKIGVLPNPNRKNGIREYSEQDLEFILFINGLKKTGMKLEDIAKFSEDGCLKSQTEETIISDTLSKRIDILTEHLESLEQQLSDILAVKKVAEDKKAFYSSMLHNKR
ncbi:MerR family transcriptional regulator [Bacillus sp. 31A1R]|uniref:MerR family transcriptional regulator n=1 Tax=Robertmurraya mangrovi TaxID=3098077 RepID=A0ABU5J426_9BACI|nr:MerR family transcriptional regulator [Bacillus sp. 31A1R]MDZ5474097.1 MerR family transcriptional regulator [Bacillus sp. 31A1R]